jgi:hypothetical protein
LLRPNGPLSNLDEGAVVAMASVSVVAETAVKLQVASDGNPAEQL